MRCPGLECLHRETEIFFDSQKNCAPRFIPVLAFNFFCVAATSRDGDLAIAEIRNRKNPEGGVSRRSACQRACNVGQKGYACERLQPGEYSHRGSAAAPRLSKARRMFFSECGVRARFFLRLLARLGVVRVLPTPHPPAT